ncbi:MAG: hypothetical protein JWM80_5130 [Cyanobacteria bacterium RYN_339]|nr:hypothetical protein [Cyanobacteria bacterium RYN_339]
MNTTWIARIALGLVATAALAGCGKAAPTAKSAVVESVFATTTAENAAPQVVQQQQARKDQDASTDTSDVGGPGNEKN